jgi:DNA-binding CsgD family transcriptional regulator
MVITTLGDEKTVIAAIEAGASGYLLKDGSFEEIGAALVELVAGGSPIRPSIARQILRRLQREDAEPTSAAPHLTERAHEILSSIAKGFSFPEIAGLLSISTHTVTTRVRHIYRKREVTSRASAVSEAVQLGLIRIDGRTQRGRLVETPAMGVHEVLGAPEARLPLDQVVDRLALQDPDLLDGPPFRGNGRRAIVEHGVETEPAVDRYDERSREPD